MLPTVQVKPELDFSSQIVHSETQDSSETETCQPRPEELGPEELGRDPAHCREECSGPGFFPNLSPPFCLNSQPFNVSASLKAYADRMQADYFRYRLAKESAENFYSRLAVFHNTFNPFRYYLNPFALRQFSCPSPASAPPASPGVDLSLKPLTTHAKQLHPTPSHCLEDVKLKKRQFEENDSVNPGEKRQKLSMKRKIGKKSPATDETSSPVSGTVIRQLGEGESLPEIRKGKLVQDISYISILLVSRTNTLTLENVEFRVRLEEKGFSHFS